ncbi:MAG: DNA methyltransferase [Rikenellaceae bacterium]
MYKRVISTEWDFRSADTKEYTHCYHSYPAMMIPQIARKLIDDFAPNENLKLILDPYMGSGTTLVEASIKGINSIGFDINPLAKLIANAKVSLFDIEKIESSLDALSNKINCYVEDSMSFDKNDYEHITKSDYWYSRSNLLKLRFLTNAIELLTDESVKAFFRIPLSEVIREVSYTRNGEFKRYRLAEDKISQFKPNTFGLFFDKCERNKKGLIDLINTNKTFSAIITDCNSVQDIPNSIVEDESVDMIVTSPPYGDSRTTVAYGQFSRWSSEWFKFDNAKNIDRILMGGIPNKTTKLYSKTISKELDLIKREDEKRYIEVITFLDEYRRSMINVSKKVRKGGRICYVVGNRNVKGVQIPLDYFTAEIFEDCGFKHDITIIRNIPNKRMPSKTSPTNKKGINVSTMSAEYIVILTKQ